MISILPFPREPEENEEYGWILDVNYMIEIQRMMPKDFRVDLEIIEEVLLALEKVESQ